MHKFHSLYRANAQQNETIDQVVWRMIVKVDHASDMLKGGQQPDHSSEGTSKRLRSFAQEATGNDSMELNH